MSKSAIKSPADRYAEALSSGEFSHDEVQAEAVHLLTTLWEQLIQRYEEAQKPFKLLGRTKIPKGIYMWGGVGRGKTWLMDMFYDAIPFRRKMRMHFHRFMQRVHHELNQIQGQSDPLEKVADIIYAEAVVICFDEFFVVNVSDAMILGDLFTLLFERGVTLVATSNIEPQGLYKDGLHRDRFLPTIALLERYTTVINIDSGIDYRLRVLKQANLYRSDISDDSQVWLAQRFKALTRQQRISEEPIIINHREIDIIAHSEMVLWCDFRQLCMQPRSAADFIEIANQFSTVLIGKIPYLDDDRLDPSRRLIYLVDEFYDHNVKLIITAAQPILELYQGKKLAFEIERTRSRLLEMQSEEYLSLSHKLD